MEDHTYLCLFFKTHQPRFLGVQYHLLNLDPGLIVGTVPDSLASLRGLVREERRKSAYLTCTHGCTTRVVQGRFRGARTGQLAKAY